MFSIDKLNNKTKDELAFWITEFQGIYKLDSSFWTKSDSQFILGSPKNRVCRFCKKDESQTSFNNDAHLIPKFLGNINAKCFYECDNCNILFGKYESDLSSFIGLIGFYDTPDNYGSRKIRTYRLPNSSASIYLSKRGMEIYDPKNEIFEDIEDGKVKRSKILKTPYLPLNVYKAFIKIFLSVLKSEIVNKFDKTLKFLMTDTLDSEDQPKIFSILFYHWLGNCYFDYPLIQIYRKREGLEQYELNNKIRIPDKTMILFYKNFAYQIFVPYDPIDQWLIEDDKYTVKAFVYPPILTNAEKTKTVVFKDYFSYRKNLSDKEKVKNEKDELYFRTLVGPVSLEYPQEEFEKIKRKMGIKHP